MPRACVIVLDAVGAGELPDAGQYGDEGYNTLANVAKAGYIMPYTQCAGENGTVAFTSPVDLAYGASGHYVFRHAFTGTVTFNNATFGDPISGTAKGGYYRPSY